MEGKRELFMSLTSKMVQLSPSLKSKQQEYPRLLMKQMMETAPMDLAKSP